MGNNAAFDWVSWFLLGLGFGFLLGIAVGACVVSMIGAWRAASVKVRMYSPPPDQPQQKRNHNTQTQWDDD